MISLLSRKSACILRNGGYWLVQRLPRYVLWLTQLFIIHPHSTRPIVILELSTQKLHTTRASWESSRIVRFGTLSLIDTCYNRQITLRTSSAHPHIMPSIGPQLPPHLQKRKRSPDDADESQDSPPPKSMRVANNNEIDLDDAESSDSDAGFGPSAAPQPNQTQPTPTATRRPIAPSLPPGVAVVNNDDEVNLDDDDDDDSDDNDTGPAPPSRVSGPAAPPPKRSFGPAPPPASLSERPEHDPDSDSDDDDDDDYGPALATSSSHQARAAAADAKATARAAEERASGPQRDDWMLAPPSADGAYRAPDPTKLKARKFNSGPRAGAAAAASAGGNEVSSIWTETPEEKRKRLENAVLGRDTSSSATQKSSSSGVRMGGNRKTDAEQAATRQQIEDYTQSTRGRSLYDEHQARKGGKGGKIEEEDDDPSKRAFDKEKDMKIGGKIGTAQRRELLNKAADFGGRFAKGKFL